MALLRKRREAMAAVSTQIRSQETMPFGLLDATAGLGGPEGRLYRAIREAVPVVDAAIGKIVRLCGGVTAQCTDPEGQRQLQKFLREVPTGRRQKGLQAFLDSYLDSMLTYGQGVGEMVLSGDGREIEALLCARVEHVCIREGETPLDFTICGYDSLGQPRPLPRLRSRRKDRTTTTTRNPPPSCRPKRPRRSRRWRRSPAAGSPSTAI